ncbi:hypothetical protein CFP56_011100 [Quercus suber]|uniref:Uncharacterized protein n=1 Tax=Quercus suber TaxID=58331 RepID=A0AAW0KZB7_QUESU
MARSITRVVQHKVGYIDTCVRRQRLLRSRLMVHYYWSNCGRMPNSPHMFGDEASTVGTALGPLAVRNVSFVYLLFTYATFTHGDYVMTNMKVMYVMFARRKGAMCTTEHATHVLSTYRMSLASLRPNQVSYLCWEPRWLWFHRITRCFITKETSYWDTLVSLQCPFYYKCPLVKSHMKILVKCHPSFAIHTECMNALKAVEELN